MAKAPSLEAELIRAGQEVSGLCPVLLCQTQLRADPWDPCGVPRRVFTAQGASHGSVPGGWGGAGERNECAELPLGPALPAPLSLRDLLPPAAAGSSPSPSLLLLPSPLPGPLPPFLPPSPPHPLTGPEAPAPPPALFAVNPPLALGRGFTLPSRCVPARLFRRC